MRLAINNILYVDDDYDNNAGNHEDNNEEDKEKF